MVWTPPEVSTIDRRVVTLRALAALMAAQGIDSRLQADPDPDVERVYLGQSSPPASGIGVIHEGGPIDHGTGEVSRQWVALQMAGQTERPIYEARNRIARAIDLYEQMVRLRVPNDPPPRWVLSPPDDGYYDAT